MAVASVLAAACGSEGSNSAQSTSGTGGGSGGSEATQQSATSGAGGSGITTGTATSTASAGTGGSASGTATASSSGSGLNPDAIVFSEDFESAGNDTVPSGWDSFVGYVVNMNNSKSGQAYALADSSKAHQGTMALHVKGGQSPAMLTRPLPAGTDKLYMRAYVWLDKKLGQNPGNNHETLIAIRKSVGGAHNEFRFGEIKGVIGSNEVPSDDISPTQRQWGKGPVIEAGKWNCIEVAFLGDGAKHEVVAWNNSVEVHRVNDPSQWNNKALGSTFLDGKFVEFVLGWHSFSNFGNEVWFDDVIVATERVGCT